MSRRLTQTDGEKHKEYVATRVDNHCRDVEHQEGLFDQNRAQITAKGAAGVSGHTTRLQGGHGHKLQMRICERLWHAAYKTLLVREMVHFP